MFVITTVCTYYIEGNRAYFRDCDGETQPQTQSYCSKSGVGLGLAFSIEPPPVVPDKQQTLYVYVVEIILYVQRYIVPPTVDELLDQRVHVV